MLCRFSLPPSLMGSPDVYLWVACGSPLCGAWPCAARAAWWWWCGCPCCCLGGGSGGGASACCLHCEVLNPTTSMRTHTPHTGIHTPIHTRCVKTPPRLPAGPEQQEGEEFEVEDGEGGEEEEEEEEHEEEDDEYAGDDDEDEGEKKDEDDPYEDEL